MSRRAEREEQGAIRFFDRSVWAWVVLVSFPVWALAGAGMALVYSEYRKVEQRLREEVRIPAEQALRDAVLGLRGGVQQFALGAEAIQRKREGSRMGGVGVEKAGHRDSDYWKAPVAGLESERGGWDISRPGPAGWVADLDEAQRGLWQTSERRVSAEAPRETSKMWSETAGKLRSRSARLAAEFEMLRWGVRAGSSESPLEDWMKFRKGAVNETSASGVPLVCLLWREVFRLPWNSRAPMGLREAIEDDLLREPAAFWGMLLDEAEKTWARESGEWARDVKRWRTMLGWVEAQRALGRRVSLRMKEGEVTAPVRVESGGETWWLMRKETAGRPSSGGDAGGWDVAPDWVMRESIEETRNRARKHFARWPFLSVEFEWGEYRDGFVESIALKKEELWTALEMGSSSPLGAMKPRVAVFLADRGAMMAGARGRAGLWAAVLGMGVLATTLGAAQSRRAYLRQRELTESQSNFVASVTHELRAPLGSVRLLAENLRRNPAMSEAARLECYGLIVQECRRLGGLVENVLEWSRIERGMRRYERTLVNVGAMIRSTVDLMRPAYEAGGVRLEWAEAAGEEGVEIVGDGLALQRALVNLLDNALKHSPEGAGVRVELEAGKEWLMVFVRDEGPGILEGERERVFERFYRTGSELRRETAGVGLGLSLVKHCVEGHGGAAGVGANPGVGACFWMRLPRVCDAGKAGRGGGFGESGWEAAGSP